jgi:uncharacterized protein (UPF0261 family)
MTTIAIIGTLDTKGEEFRFLKEEVERQGARALVVHTGIVGEPLFAPDVGADVVARAGGESLEALRGRGDRGHAVTAMAAGVAVLAPRLHQEGRLDGVISLGGSAGASIGTAAMRALPIGVPKVMITTLASGDTRPYVDVADITMIYPVVDIAGLNRISRQIIRQGAAAVVAMAGASERPAGGNAEASAEDRPLIGATMFGVTTPCVTRARERLEAAGYEVLVFHATGTGGRAMENLVRGGFLAGVLDITTTELADELVGGVLSAGPHRLEAAGACCVPQVVCPGALDMVNFGPRDTVPQAFAGRTFYQHNPNVTLMRTTPAENADLGRIVAGKLNRAEGPVVVLLPLGGVSAIDRDGQPFHSPEADEAFRQALKANLDPRIPLRELDLHINDPSFADAAAEALLGLITRKEPASR